MPRFSFKNVVQLTKKQLDKKKVEANQQLQKNNSALKKGVKALEEETKKAKEVAKSVAEEVKKGVKEKTALNTSLKSLIAKHSQAESILIGKKSKLDEISKKATKLIKDVADKEKRLEVLNNAINHANEIKPDIIKLKNELKSTTDKLNVKKIGLDDFVIQEDILKDRIKDLAEEYEKKTKPYIEQIEEVKEKQASLRKKYKEEVANLEANVKNVAGTITKKANELKDVNREIQVAKTILNDEFDKIKSATTDLKQLEREKAVIVREIADRKKRFEGWTLKAMEGVAKMTLKNKLDKIDKAGLKDIMNAL